jgi:hypothetical protein
VCFLSKINVICIMISLMCICQYGHASESLRIAGMGGVFVAVQNTETSVYGNPAGLTVVEANNVSAELSTQNLDYQSLPTNDEASLNTMVSFRLTPTICYSRAIGKFGVALGYLYDLDNRGSTLEIDKTTAEYAVDERKFTSDTNTILKYNLFRESVPIISLGYSAKPDMTIGFRLKYRHQIFKKGVITRPLRLSAVHGPDVNRNDATKLLPAIINNLDIGKSIENFKNGEDSTEEVESDLSGKGIDIDLGIQTKIYDKSNVYLGFMLEHLIQRKVALAQPSVIRIGISAIPLSWLNAGFDVHKSLSKKGLEMNLGWEAHCEWQRWFSGGVVFRNGFSRESSENNLSLGIGLSLGGSEWDYALVKPLDGSSISKATHKLSSTTRF